MRTLLIDNYDSFTYNLFQLLAEENGIEPVVVRNDEASWAELAALEFDNVVLSPGPGRPERRRDFGVCAEAIRNCETPLLGVCLGQQGLGWVYGGRVTRAPQPMHGWVRPVEHDGSPLFAGIPRRFEATRYHSLCLEQPLPAELEAIAVADDGVVMAVAHRSRPQWGVQFHPESIATEHGRRLLANFRDLTVAGKRSSVDLFTQEVNKSTLLSGTPGRLGLRTRRLESRCDSVRVFSALYGDSRHAFWLDSSRPGPGARFSFMGDASGPLAATISYKVEKREVTVRRGGEVETFDESIFDYLERELARLRPLATDLPFDFSCGFVGYLGYELKAECGAESAHSSPHPDAAFVFADRLLVFDHEQDHVYLLALHGSDDEAVADTWLSATASRLAGLEADAGEGAPGEGSAEPPRCCSDGPLPARPPKPPSASRVNRSAISKTSPPASSTSSMARAMRSV